MKYNQQIILYKFDFGKVVFNNLGYNLHSNNSICGIVSIITDNILSLSSYETKKNMYTLTVEVYEKPQAEM